MKIIYQLALMLFLLTSISSSVEAQEEKINHYLDRMEELGFSGSVLVALGGEVILNKGYGVADRENNIPVESNTIFTVGSITKQFTGAAILKLEMMGKLKVTDLMSKYIKDVPRDKSNITIHHLLTHSAGFAGAIGNDNELINSEDFLERAMTEDLLFTPGSKYRYSNVGYSILGIIIEKISGITYESFLHTYFFTPINMSRTGYVLPGYQSNEVAVGYRRDGSRWGRVTDKNWGEEGPGWHLKANGGIHSTVEDMYLWHMALLGDDILSQRAKEKYYTRHIEEREGAGTYYGYGWAIFPTPRNTELIAHNGGNGIFFADFWRYLSEDITIIFMTNNGQRKYEDIASNIASILLRPDFEPRIPDAGDNSNEEEEMIMEALTMEFFETINTDDEDVWKEFLTEKTTLEFQRMADMAFHLKMFRQMHEVLKGQSPQNAELEGRELIISMSDGSSVMLGFEKNGDGKMLIGGIGVE